MIVKVSIPSKIKMMLPAMMIKTHSPAMELYEIKAISDQEIREANQSFLEKGLPYMVIRSDAAAAEVAA